MARRRAHQARDVVAVGAVHGDGQVALEELPQQLREVGPVGDLDEDRERAEALVEERAEADAEVGDGDGDDRGRHPALAALVGAHRSGVDDADARGAEDLLAPPHVAFGDARVEHPVLLDLGRGRGDRVVEAVAGGKEDETGLGAQLPGGAADARDEPGGDLARACGEGAGGHEDGVHAAELAVERDRVRAGGGDVGEHPAAADRTGERGGLDQRVPEHRRPGVLPGDELQRPRRETRAFERGGDDLGGALGQERMAGMGLDDDGVARGEGRGGVASGDGEREREVARGEVQHGPDRLVDAAHVGPGPEREVGVGAVDPGVEVGAVDDRVGEEPQLDGGPLQLAAQPGLGQAGLAHRERHQVVGLGRDRVRRGDERGGAGRGVDPREGARRLVGGARDRLEAVCRRLLRHQHSS